MDTVVAETEGSIPLIPKACLWNTIFEPFSSTHDSRNLSEMRWPTSLVWKIKSGFWDHLFVSSSYRYISSNAWSIWGDLVVCLCLPNFLVFYTVRVISKESGPSVLPRTSCINIIISSPSQSLNWTFATWRGEKSRHYRGLEGSYHT
jgi:hypothetical protein